MKPVLERRSTGSQRLVVALLGVTTLASAEQVCQDTPDWSNFWSGCAYMEGGKNASLCNPTPGAAWPSTNGWTCEYYRQQGFCGKEGVDEATMREIRGASFGGAHNFPENNCCGCAPNPSTSCNRQTGKTCAMTACGTALGPALCENVTSCMCRPGHCADSEGVCSLIVEQAITGEKVGTCQDHFDWTNLWSPCAWDEGGKNASWCLPTPGAAWPSTAGWTCEFFRQHPDHVFKTAEQHNNLKLNCCGLGEKQEDTSCNRNTGGACKMGACSSSRGPTVCELEKCMCAPGHCGAGDGTCSLGFDSKTADKAAAKAAGAPTTDQARTKYASAAGQAAAKVAESQGAPVKEQVAAAAKAAGKAAASSGLTPSQATDAIATAAAASAVAAGATPEQAASVAAAEAVKEAQVAGKPVQEQATAAAEAAAKAAHVVAKENFWTPEQAANAAKDAATAAATSAGLPPQQAVILADQAVTDAVAAELVPVADMDQVAAAAQIAGETAASAGQTPTEATTAIAAAAAASSVSEGATPEQAASVAAEEAVKEAVSAGQPPQAQATAAAEAASKAAYSVATESGLTDAQAASAAKDAATVAATNAGIPQPQAIILADAAVVDAVAAQDVMTEMVHTNEEGSRQGRMIPLEEGGRPVEKWLIFSAVLAALAGVGYFVKTRYGCSKDAFSKRYFRTSDEESAEHSETDESE